MEGFYKGSPDPSSAKQPHLWGPAQQSHCWEQPQLCQSVTEPQTRALQSQVDLHVGRSVAFLTEIQVAPLRNL